MSGVEILMAIAGQQEVNRQVYYYNGTKTKHLQINTYFKINNSSVKDKTLGNALNSID